MKIDTTSLDSDFLHHLNVEGNNRIIFSGKFGLGKSTYLHDFFQRATDKYVPITISPVNYSVSSNEDIFELIKYDLLTRLVELENIEEYKECSLADFKKILEDPKFQSLAKDIVKHIPKLGEALVKTIDIGKHLVYLWEKFKEVNFSTNILIAEEYLNVFQEKVGSPYEYNNVSKLISEMVSILRTASSRKPLLIIDDFDRIDPEHVFRILNVFGCHYNDQGNKFGFDHVVIVCDINNIRKMFATKYGIDVDFSGYIDKFYSKSIFEFAMERLICAKVQELLKPSIDRIERANKNRVLEITEAVVSEMIRLGDINLRTLVNLENLDTNFKSKIGYHSKDQKSIIGIYYFPILATFHLLSIIHGTRHGLAEVLKRRMETKYIYSIENVLVQTTICDSLLLLNSESSLSASKLTIQFEEMVFELGRYGRGPFGIENITSGRTKVEDVPVWRILYAAFIYLDDLMITGKAEMA